MRLAYWLDGWPHEPQREPCYDDGCDSFMRPPALGALKRFDELTPDADTTDDRRGRRDPDRYERKGD